MSVRSISSVDDLQRIVTNGLVVIDAKAQWCPPCQAIAPKVDGLAREYSNVTFVKFDVDESPDLASHYNITAMPTFLFIKDGKMVDVVKGADYQKIVRTIKAHL